MLNKEKYANELIEIVSDGDSVAVVEGKPVHCCGISCRCCDLNDGRNSCRDIRKKWANSEYEEPIDWNSVEPGTMIKVQDIDSKVWQLRKFAFVIDGKVACYRLGYEDSEYPVYKTWRRAKLLASTIFRERGNNEKYGFCPFSKQLNGQDCGIIGFCCDCDTYFDGYNKSREDVIQDIKEEIDAISHEIGYDEGLSILERYIARGLKEEE